MSLVNCCRHSTEMKFHAMRFVRFANQIAHFASQHFLQRCRSFSHDCDLQFAFAQRPCHFQPNEA